MEENIDEEESKKEEDKQRRLNDKDDYDKSSISYIYYRYV